MPQLFGLFVGVARYHPASKVPHLTGCEYCKPADIYQVGCHHMNYFEEEVSLKVLQEIIQA